MSLQNPFNRFSANSNAIAMVNPDTALNVARQTRMVAEQI